MIDSLVNVAVGPWPSLFLLLSIWYLARNYFNRGLQKYPGPFLASLTDWWRFFDVLGRRPEITHDRLHKQHGDIVRLGPNSLSFADPQALKTIYALNRGFTKVSASPAHSSYSNAKLCKSEFYPVIQAMSKGERLLSLFSTTDEKYHAELRKCVSGAFSMTAVIQYERAVDSLLEKFLDQTEALFVSKNATCDFAKWLQFLAFDVIGEITYSKPHGFVDKEEDIDGMIGYLGRLINYVAPVCFRIPPSSPWLIQYLLPDRPDPHARQPPPQKPTYSLPRPIRYQSIHLSRRRLRQSPHRRASRRPRVREEILRPLFHHNPSRRPPLHVPQSPGIATAILPRWPRPHHGRQHGCRRLRNHRHLPRRSLLLPTQEPPLLRKADDRAR